MRRVAIALTPEDYQRARRHLMRRDPRLASAIKRIGPCGLADRQRRDHLTVLIGAIVSQQLSTKAAATIFGRFVALFPEGAITNAAAVERLTDAQLARRRAERTEGRLSARPLCADRRRAAGSRRARDAGG